MSVSIETPIHFKRAKAGRKKLAAGKPEPKKQEPPDPVPRISRLMALAIHFDGLIREGLVRDYADLARLGGVSRARITQIMNLLNLPPWKQEELLFLEGGKGRAGVTERAARIFLLTFRSNKHTLRKENMREIVSGNKNPVTGLDVP